MINMTLMANLLRSIKPSIRIRRRLPVRVATDRIIPLTPYDDNFPTRQTMVHAMLAFNTVLDPSKLHEKLRLLLGREGWNKLGARLRHNVSSKNKIFQGAFSKWMQAEEQSARISYSLQVQQRPSGYPILAYQARNEPWRASERTQSAT